MMYLNTAKQLLLASTSKRSAPMLRQAAMSYFMVNKNAPSAEAKLFMATARRAFSSFPPHVKLEMPNLSPTMEKVKKAIIIMR